MRSFAPLMLLCLLAFASIPVVAQCDRATLSPIKCGYYDEGYQDGIADARNDQANDYRRYRNKFESQYENFYRQGYDAGYGSIRPFSRWNDQQRDAYDAGYRFGETDRRRGVSRLPARYEGQYDRNNEPYYQQGYFDGYDGRPRQYDTPLGGTTFPPSGQNGTATGTASWSGRVDNMANVIIQGANIRSEDITNSGLQPGYQSMNGVLPRRASTVSVRKTGGRGSATVIQQPSRANDYVAIIRISDPQGGADNYRLDISWTSSAAEEPYTSGRVMWRGRVDQTVNIAISGTDVQTQNVSGSVLPNENFNITGYLARRPGTVTAVKRRGRGTVTVIQQPSLENDFTAVIQVFDPNRSDDNYEVEISW